MSCRRDTLNKEASTNLYLQRHMPRRNRRAQCKALNLHSTKLLAQRLLNEDRDGTDSCDRRAADRPGRGTWTSTHRNFRPTGRARHHPLPAASMAKHRLSKPCRLRRSVPSSNSPSESARRAASSELARVLPTCPHPIFRVGPVRSDRFQHRLPLARQTPPAGFFWIPAAACPTAGAFKPRTSTAFAAPDLG